MPITTIEKVQEYMRDHNIKSFSRAVCMLIDERDSFLGVANHWKKVAYKSQKINYTDEDRIRGMHNVTRRQIERTK